jgi:hypothetical protein
MPRYLVEHKHEPQECGVAFAAFKGHDSPLRRHPALSSCPSGGHSLWWLVDSENAQAALALLPFFVAARSRAIRVGEVAIP